MLVRGPEEFAVSGEKNIVPREQVMRRRFSCMERHPGLCFRLHEDIYDEALKMAEQVEKWVTWLGDAAGAVRCMDTLNLTAAWRMLGCDQLAGGISVFLGFLMRTMKRLRKLCLLQVDVHVGVMLLKPSSSPA